MKQEKMSKTDWKIVVIILLFLLVTVFILQSIKYNYEKQEERKCMIDVCEFMFIKHDVAISELGEYYDYNPKTKECFCYKDGKIVKQEVIE